MSWIIKHRYKLGIVIGTIALLVTVELLLGFILVPASYADEIPLDLEAIQAEGKEVNCIIVGDSTARGEIDPIELEQQLGGEYVTFNYAMNAVRLSEEQYHLEELLEKHEPEMVIIALNYLQLCDNEENHWLEGLAVERLHNPRIKIKAIAGTEIWRHGQYLLKSYRYRDKDRHGNILENISNRLKTKDQKLKDKTTIRGFQAADLKGIPDEEITPFTVKKEELNDKMEHGLRNMLQMCDEAGIETYLIVMPFAIDAVLNNIETVQYLNELAGQMAEEYGITFYDLNLMKERDEILGDESIDNGEHFSKESVIGITDQFAYLINATQNNESTSQILYDNYEDVLSVYCE